MLGDHDVNSLMWQVVKEKVMHVYVKRCVDGQNRTPYIVAMAPHILLQVGSKDRGKDQYDQDEG